MFIIISPDTKQHHLLNLRNALELVDIVETLGYDYKVGTGCYKGKKENCVKVEFHHSAIFDVLAQMSDLMDAYKQECLLFVDDSGNGSLLHADGSNTRLGVWHEISALELAVTHEDHTEIEGHYYVCK